MIRQGVQEPTAVGGVPGVHGRKPAAEQRCRASEQQQAAAAAAAAEETLNLPSHGLSCLSKVLDI